MMSKPMRNRGGELRNGNISIYKGIDKNKNKSKNTKKDMKIEKRDFSRKFIFILASNKTSKEIIVIKTKTKQEGRKERNNVTKIK